MKKFLPKRKHLELQNAGREGNLKLKLPEVNFSMYHNDNFH